MAFLRPEHIHALRDRIQIDEPLDPKQLVPEILDRLDELDVPPDPIVTAEAFIEAVAVDAALRYAQEQWWSRRQGQDSDWAAIKARRSAIQKSCRGFASPHLIKKAADGHAATVLLTNKAWSNQVDAGVRHLTAAGFLRRGRMENETFDRAFVVGYAAPIRMAEDSSDDQGRHWPRYEAAPDILALPTWGHVPEAAIAALPPLEAFHTRVPCDLAVGHARRPGITRHTRLAVQSIIDAQNAAARSIGAAA